MSGSGYKDLISPWWRLADTLSVIEASLLVLGIEPQDLADDIERRIEANQPDGYRAVKAGILAGLKSKSLQGWLKHPEHTDFHGNLSQDDTRYDLHASYVQVESLITWLRSRGFATGYFFSEDPQHHGLKDVNHPRYAPKLAAAVEAWESYDEESPAPGTAKQKLATWLRLHAAKYGLTDADGKLRETVIEHLATIANWATKGGAPKTEIPEPAPLEPRINDNDLEDEIPF
ncbi:MAG: hypothetical protein ACK4M6_02695 [Hyphomonas sp.]